MASQGRCLSKVDQSAIDAGAQVTLLHQVFKEIPELTLLILHDRSQNQEAGARRMAHQAVNNLVGGLSLNGKSGNVTVTLSGAGKQYTQIIVDFRDRADGAARIAAGGFLLDGNGRCESADRIDLRLRHLAQKLPGIRGQGFHIAPLTFGVQRIKREGTFAGSADSGHHDQLVSRQRQIDVSQIVFTCATDNDVRTGHGSRTNASDAADRGRLTLPIRSGSQQPCQSTVLKGDHCRTHGRTTPSLCSGTMAD